MQGKHSETALVQPSDPIIQGDIIEWRHKVGYWKQYGIILTTDCDLDKGKNDDVFSYCPIISLDQYFKEIYVYSKIDTKKYLGAIAKRVYPGLNLDLSALSSTIIDLGINESLRYFGPKSEKVKEYVEVFFNVLTRNGDPFDIWIRNHKINGKVVKDAKQELLNEMKGFICNLPGDLFYFNVIEGCQEPGFIINLRRIGMLSRKEIAVSWDDRKSRDVCVSRIATLLSPYKYYVTKRFANVFSDIGLPEEYEDDREAAIELFADSYGG